MPIPLQVSNSRNRVSRASRYLSSPFVKRHPFFIFVIALVLVTAVWSLTPRSSALSNSGAMTTVGTPLTENFNTLALSGTGLVWTDNATVPGWYSSRATYNTGNGSSATGSLLSYGSNASTERALGTLASGGTGTITHGARLINNTGTSITSLDLSYVGEQWRNGGNTTPQILQFQYQVVDAGTISNINGGVWTNFNALNFTSLINTASFGPLDGNNPANRAVISASIPVNVSPGQEVWVRWVDVDDSGNDHGLGIDDFSVTPQHSDPPSITSAVATPSIVDPGNDTLLTVSVVPGASPTSTNLSVTGDLSTIGGSATQIFFDDGTNGDLLPGDNIFSFNSSVSFGTPGGAKNLPVTVSDEQLRSGSSSITLTVNTPAPLLAIGNADPGLAHVGDNSLLIVTVTPGTSPTSTGINVTGNLSAIGGSTSQQFYDDGTNGDITAGNNVFSYLATISSGTGTGAKTLPVDVTDAQARSTSTSILLNVVPTIIINELDSDTVGTDTLEFVELYDGGNGNTSLDGLVVVFFNGSSDLSYSAFDLDGHTTDANGYFTLGNAAVPGVDYVFADNLLQNGADAVAIYFVNNSNFINGTSISTTNLIDAAVYDTADADDPGLLVLLNSGEPQVDENGGGSGATQSIQRCPNGAGGTRNTSTYSAGTPSPDTSNNCLVTPPPTGNSAIVISQLYGGGGNSGATFQNDYIELYNRGTTTIDIGGWSLQYASATGSGWDSNKQPLGGTIGPGEYFLISLAGGLNGSPLPVSPNINGEINMSGTSGKVALVSNFEGLVGNCPTVDPDVVDLVGYGSADCHEGSGNAPAPSNSTAIFRQGGGTVDTNNNGNDFAVDSPGPRRTAPIVELGPWVLNTDPRSNAFNAPRDASISVTFTEPVTVTGSWFDISCASTGQHNSATVAGSDKDWVITPNVNFLAGEQCTVTINKDLVHDVDSDDSGPDTDTLPANYSWVFTVSNGTAPAYPTSVHLEMGNPNGATADSGVPNNYLMEKPEFALSYNRDHGGPNWVSWHLSDEWIGTLTRVDTFRPDPAVLPEWYRVQASDFSSSGFDRGHMTPNADRDKETSIPINQATFLMSNMVAQSPDNNQGPWAAFENYLRTLLPANELYIVAGPRGTGGTGSNGFANTIANGNVHVPSATWKVVLVIPKGDNDLTRVTAGSHTIAIDIANVQGIRNDPWQNYVTTVDNVEALTGFDFFSNIPDAIENAIEAGTNGINPPGTSGQTVTTSEDNSVNLTLTGVSPGGPLTYTIVTPPAHGQLTGSDANRSYEPNPNYNGADSFTFKVNDGAQDSNTSTVSITVNPVNDAPTADNQSVSTNSNTPVDFMLTGSDLETTAANLNFVVTVNPTHGSLSGSGTNLTYTPAANYSGPDSFKFTVTDTGDGTAEALTSGEAHVDINVNDNINPTVTAPANVTLGTGAGATACSLLISDATLGTASASDNSGVVTIERTGVPAGNIFPVGTTLISYTAIDGAGNTAQATQTVIVNDTTPPSLTAPTSISAVANSSGQSAVPNVVADATASDFCSEVTVTQSPAAGTMVGIGPHTITLTATDAAGNTSTATTTFTVQSSGGALTFTLSISPSTVKRGKFVKLRASYSNETGAAQEVTFKLHYSSPCGNATIGDIGPINIRSRGHGSVDLPLYISDNACTGVYTVTIESFVGGTFNGSTTATLTVRQ